MSRDGVMRKYSHSGFTDKYNSVGWGYWVGAGVMLDGEILLNVIFIMIQKREPVLLLEQHWRQVVFYLIDSISKFFPSNWSCNAQNG